MERVGTRPRRRVRTRDLRVGHLLVINRYQYSARACPRRVRTISSLIVCYYFTATGINNNSGCDCERLVARFRPVRHVRPERFQPSPAVVRARPRVVGRRRQVADGQTTGQRSRAFLFGQGMIDRNVYNNTDPLTLFLTIGYALNTCCRRIYGTSSKSSPRT